jgi:branched-chain amino acid transport system permease protein
MRHRLIRIAAVVVLAGLLLALPFFLRNYGLNLYSRWALIAAAAIGLNLTLGYAGQVSLGHAAFLGFGAYLSAFAIKAGWGLWPAIPAAALFCFVVGLALGFPALRVQHHYLAFATLGFNALAFLAMRNEEWLTGGNYGITRILRPTLFGHALRDSLSYAYVCLAVLAAVMLAAWWILRSPWGRAFAALRDNPIRAESLGIDIRAYTLLAFAIGGAFAGIAGVFYAPLVGYIDPNLFTPLVSIDLLLIVIVGGAGRFLGPVLGATVGVLLPEWLRFMGDWYLVIFGLLVVALMAWCPTGLLGLPERLGLDRRLAARRQSTGAAG